MVKGASFNRAERFKIMALTDQLPTLTAYANDVSYDSVFVEQLRNFAQPGDLFMGISGSRQFAQRAARHGVRQFRGLQDDRPDAAAMAGSLDRWRSSISTSVCRTWAASKMRT